MSKQKKYLINGIFLLILGVLTVTFVPKILEGLGFGAIQKSVFSEISFCFLAACGIYYIFAPKYYKFEIISITIAIIYCVLFSKFCSIIF